MFTSLYADMILAHLLIQSNMFPLKLEVNLHDLTSRFYEFKTMTSHRIPCTKVLAYICHKIADDRAVRYRQFLLAFTTYFCIISDT